MAGAYFFLGPSLTFEKKSGPPPPCPGEVTLRKKMEPKQCPLGTVLKNGALFSKKGTKTVPLWQSAPHQKGTIQP